MTFCQTEEKSVVPNIIVETHWVSDYRQKVFIKTCFFVFWLHLQKHFILWFFIKCFVYICKCTRKQDKYTYCVLPRQLHLEKILMQMRHYLIMWYAQICIILQNINLNIGKSQISKFKILVVFILLLFIYLRL